MVKAVVLGAAGGIGQVCPASNRTHLDFFTDYGSLCLCSSRSLLLSMNSVSLMSSTPPVWRLICPTSPQSPYVLPLTRPQSSSRLTTLQDVEGTVAAKGDFKGEQPETEEAKKKALTGADIVIIPAGVPRM